MFGNSCVYRVPQLPLWDNLTWRQLHIEFKSKDIIISAESLEACAKLSSELEGLASDKREPLKLSFGLLMDLKCSKMHQASLAPTEITGYGDYGPGWFFFELSRWRLSTRRRAGVERLCSEFAIIYSCTCSIPTLLLWL